MTNLEYLLIKIAIEHKIQKEKVCRIYTAIGFAILGVTMLALKNEYYPTSDILRCISIILLFMSAIYIFRGLFSSFGQENFKELNQLYHQKVEAEQTIEQLDLLPKKQETN